MAPSLGARFLQCVLANSAAWPSFFAINQSTFPFSTFVVSKMKFNPETPLYTSDQRSWGIDAFAVLMTTLLELGKPIVFFVHGRGREPEKSLHRGEPKRGKAVHKIELGYNVSTVMFNWRSAFKWPNIADRDLPLRHTSAGGKSLGLVLEQLLLFQAKHPQAPKPALLVHSMGSIVVQKAVQEGHWPEARALFSNLLFSQPDCDDVGHAEWLDEIASRESTYLTLNEDDKILKRSRDARPRGSRALGLGTSQPLSPQAKYIDISRMGPLGIDDDDHEVFHKGNMDGQVHLCRFFTEVLTGANVILDQRNVESVERGVIYRLRHHLDRNAPCVETPRLP